MTVKEFLEACDCSNILVKEENNPYYDENSTFLRALGHNETFVVKEYADCIIKKIYFEDMLFIVVKGD